MQLQIYFNTNFSLKQDAVLFSLATNLLKLETVWPCTYVAYRFQI